jgi:hypothetical protein
MKGGAVAKFDLLRTYLSPAEDERVVRAYHCTSHKSKLLSLDAEGYLTITNKRVVFYAYGSSYQGRSILQSEIPIEDVSGINSYKGTYFSLLHILGVIIVTFIVASILNALIIAVAGGATLFASYKQSSNGNWTDVWQVLLWILAIGTLVGSFYVPKDRAFRSILAALSAMFFAQIVGVSSLGALSLILGRDTGRNIVAFIAGIVAFAVGIYTLVCFFWYARREAISLAIGSRGGSSTPIAISGVPSFSLYNTAAFKALSAEPAIDAEMMIKELGAMILDIQTLGDLGIQKWQVH